MLRIGYYAAHLILAVRALEESGNAMSPKTFLSNLDGSPSASHDLPDSAASKNSTHLLHAHTLRYAHSVLDTFVEMPPFLMNSIPTYLCLCIGYCALILAHYDESQSKVSADVTLGLIGRLEDWCMRTPSKSWAIKFAKLARQKVEARTGNRLHPDLRKSASRDKERRHLPGWTPNETALPAFSVATEHGATPSSLTENRPFDAEEFVTPTDTFPLGSEAMHPTGYDVAQPVIPSMEDFFGGGFLDFMRQPRG